MTQPQYQPGPFDRKHLLVVWGGLLPGNETWCCSVKLADGRPGSPAAANNLFLDQVNTQTYADDFIAPEVLAFHTRPDSHVSPRAILQYVKVNLINVDGHYDAEGTSEHVFTNTPGGGNAAVYLPNQIASCVSLLTSATRGPAHRGRFYLPYPTLGMSGDGSGLVDAGQANAQANSVQTFLEAISDVPGLDLPSSPGAVVMSRKAGAPRTRMVTGVEVGRVLDTQRRRRRSLPELYQYQAVDQGLA